MQATEYDAIVVGARCAGSPVAMQLSRVGWRVLLVDRATFPSDTLSTHAIHPQGVAALQRWGLLDRLVATGCPPIDTYRFQFGPFAIAGHPRPVEGVGVAYAPRRTILDALLVEAAREAGAELWEGTVVENVLWEGGSVAGIRARRGDAPAVTVRAPVVIGADGRNSLVAASVHAPSYRECPAQLVAYYAYWSGLPMEGRFETYPQPMHRRGWGVAQTHDDLTMVVVGWPVAEMAANRGDLEASYQGAFRLVPAFAERIAAAVRETPIRGGVTPNFFRRPFGRGWALVGDAGYTKDPITAQGISDAFLDGERCVQALDEWRTGGRPFADALGAYQADRDRRAMPMYEFTIKLASMEMPGPDLMAVVQAAAGSPEGSDLFASASAGTAPLSELFAFAQRGGRALAAAPAAVGH
ncbi:MAG TPA: NAD(P)/FAD-dependent oxidoreductase [Actinomycetota bacterium]|nr:NAD(P)/FAD-dependent oxidoreductase [Actinomycetota bacterium]